jgi:hypothetical protein
LKTAVNASFLFWGDFWARKKELNTNSFQLIRRSTLSRLSGFSGKDG